MTDETPTQDEVKARIGSLIGKLSGFADAIKRTRFRMKNLGAGQTIARAMKLRSVCETMNLDSVKSGPVEVLQQPDGTWQVRITYGWDMLGRWSDSLKEKPGAD